MVWKTMIKKLLNAELQNIVNTKLLRSRVSHAVFHSFGQQFWDEENELT